MVMIVMKRTSKQLSLAGLCVMLLLNGAPVLAMAVPHDVNGDGRADVVWRNTNNGATHVWQMTAAGLRGPVTFPGSLPANWEIRGVADVNGDGRADVMWRNTTNGATHVWQMTASGTRGPVTFPGGLPLHWEIRGVADVNGDGRADVVWRNTTTGATMVWQMTAAGLRGPITFSGGVPLNWEIRGVADVNGDGRADVVWRNTTTGATMVWQMTAGATRGPIIFPGGVPVNWRLEDVADVNGDGRADLVWRNTNNGATMIWQMTAQGLRGPITFAGGVPVNWEIENVADVNGDGRADLIWRNTNNGGTMVWQMTAGATRGPITFPGSIPMGWQLEGAHSPVVSIKITSSVFSDTDNSYATGNVVRIDIEQPAIGRPFESGTIQITSASQGYDSGEQPLLFASNIFFLWDTTGLSPASDYRVTVSLTDTIGQTTTEGGVIMLVLEPNPPLVNKLVRNVDIQVPATGFPVQFVRTYLLDSTFDGPMGYGWSHSYRMRIDESLGNIRKTLTNPPNEGWVQVFNADGTGSFFASNGDGTFQASKGDFRVLTKNTDGSYQLKEKFGTQFHFEPLGKLSSIQDRNGNVLTLTYDTKERLMNITDPSNRVTNFSYDATDRISSITDPMGRSIFYAYDGVGNLTSVTDFGGHVTRYDYDAGHNLTRVSDPAGRNTFFSANDADRLVTVAEEGDVNKIIFEYFTPSPNQLTVTDALGNKTVVTYDTNASISHVVDGLGHSNQFVFDQALNLVSLIDAHGGTTDYTYDGRGNVLSLKNAEGHLITFTYDPSFNQVTSLTDARGKMTFFQYDGNGNISGITYPDGSVESYTTNSVGNLVSRTDRKGQTLTFSYNNTGQVTTKSFPDGTSDTYAYDAAGNRISATDENGTIIFQYDSSDRLKKVTYPGNEVVAYDYDSAGNRTQLTYPDGTVLNYTYDSHSRLIEIARANQMLASYTYDALSRVIRRDLQNGIFTTYSYNASSQLLNLLNRKSTSEIISNFSYTYDKLGNRLTTSTLEGKTQYTYDAINQLVSVINSDFSSTTYNLDPAGNRIFVNDSSGTINYTANNLNQYTKVGENIYTFDANGNMTSKTTPSETIHYTYDMENQLIQAGTLTDPIIYTYDPIGRRTTKTTTSGTTKFIHDGFRVIMEKDNTNTIQATYFHGVGIDELLVMKRNGVDYYYSQDGLGSVSDLTDLSENVVESFNYDSYGKPNSLSSIGNPYQYTGREYEPEIGIYYYRLRYYDPTLGRFLSPDPIGLNGGSNLYTYVKSNPINFSDPSGLLEVTITWKRPAKCKGDIAGCALGPQIWVHPLFRGRIEAWTHEYIHARRFIIGQDTGIIAVEESIADKQMYFPEWQRLTREFLNKNNVANNGNPVGDTDGDGIPDDRDDDDDNDGIPDSLDPDPKDPNNPTCISNPELCRCEEQAPQMCSSDPTFVQASHTVVAKDFRALLESNQRGVGRDKQFDRIVSKIIVPYEDSLVRADIPISGFAYGENFQEYRVEVGEGANPSEWYTLTSSTTPQTEETKASDLDDSLNITIQGNLANWDTGLKNYVYLPSHPADHPINLKGTYTIRLVVSGTDGRIAQDRVTIHVGNVIPNAWGGRVVSPDQNVVLTVPEQSIMDSFRVILVQSTEDLSLAPPNRRQVIGSVYEVREPGERFSKSATLQMTYSEEALGQARPDQLGVYGYNAEQGQWEYLKSFRRQSESIVFTSVSRLHSHYALMVSPLPTEGSGVEPSLGADAVVHQVSHVRTSGRFLVQNTFEDGFGDWSNRDGAVGATVQLEDSTTGADNQALKISNTNAGGNFAVNVHSKPFDVREFPLVQFDYRITPDVKTNWLVKVAGRWYEIGFTDDPKELNDQRVNIAHIGDIADVKADDVWHTATFNLYDMLRTKTRHSQVEAIVMADWDVPGYMKLQFGHNAQGATYYIDNFTISRSFSPGVTVPHVSMLIDDFNQQAPANSLTGIWSTFTDGRTGKIDVSFNQDDVLGQGYALDLSYDISHDGSFAGYLRHLPRLDLRDFDRLSFWVKGDQDGRHLVVGLKDVQGHESKVLVNHYLEQPLSSTWQQVSIPLMRFVDIVDWGEVELLSFAFDGRQAPKGSVLVDQVELHKGFPTLLVDNFERTDDQNSIGLPHYTFVNGAAAVEGKRVTNSPNGVYRLSYGVDTGEMTSSPKQPKSFATWTTSIGGIDCSRCEALSFKVRGAVGGENPTLYLDDGNFRWGLELAHTVSVTTEWKEVTIPVQAYAEAGVDLTHLDKLHVVFEGVKMSGTIYFDDIRLGERVP